MAGNWKMYKSAAETSSFFEKFAPLVASATHAEVVICPTFVNIPAAVEAAQVHGDWDRRAGCFLAEGRSLHRRGFRADAGQRRLPLGDHRPQRASPVLSAKQKKPCLRKPSRRLRRD